MLIVLLMALMKLTMVRNSSIFCGAVGGCVVEHVDVGYAVAVY